MSILKRHLLASMIFIFFIFLAFGSSDQNSSKSGKLINSQHTAETSSFPDYDVKTDKPYFNNNGGLNTIGIKFVYISSGEFIMGSPFSEQGRGNDENQHKVTITKGFYLSVSEITQGGWYKAMGTKPWRKNKEFLGHRVVREGDNYPAVWISWNDCQEFIKKLNHKEGTNKYRLPTEAEWEYACRAGSKTRFCFGDNVKLLDDYTWYIKNSKGKSWGHQVALKKPNAWGLYDMHGNVGEWCLDSCEYDWGKSRVITATYCNGVKDPLCKIGSNRIIRGGGIIWHAALCRSSCRSSDKPEQSSYEIGFRIVRML